MRVQSVEITNFKNIKDLKQDFVQGVYLFTGDNERGKSSLIDAIMLCLTGQNIPSESITMGETKGAIKITVGDDQKVYTIERKFTKSNPNGYLEIMTEDGMKTDKVGMLQQLFNYTDFSADEFIKWSDTAEGRRKQIEIVKSFLSADDQAMVLQMDLKKVEITKKRTEINSQIKVYDGMVKGETYNEEYRRKYAELQNIDDLNLKFQDATKFNSNREKQVQLQQSASEYISQFPENTKIALDKIDEKVLDYEKQISDLQIKIRDIIENRAALIITIEKELDELKIKDGSLKELLEKYPVIDTEIISQKIKESTQHNENHSKLIAYKAKEDKLLELKTEYANQGNELDSIANGRAEIVKKAAIPVPGLGFSEDGLTLNDLPFESTQVATSQKIEVAAKLMIAKNPKVKVFKVLNGESLGMGRLKSIIEFAEKMGYQGFIEEVKRGQDKLRIELVEKFEGGEYIAKDVTTLQENSELKMADEEFKSATIKWCVRVTREVDEDYIFHLDLEKEPTGQEILIYVLNENIDFKEGYEKFEYFKV